MMTLSVLSAGPGVTLQDHGRPGLTGIGLSQGGAADPLALLEACALLGTAAGETAIELAGLGGQFQVSAPTRCAVTGAQPTIQIDQHPQEAYTTFLLEPGQTLTVGPARNGVYSYLALAGGLEAPLVMGGHGAHLLAGLGRALEAGDQIAFTADPAPDAPALRLTPDRVETGPIRVLPGPQTALFPTDALQRFEATTFTRSTRGNRQGVRLDHDGAGFATRDQLALVSDFISVGDIQMTGDGRPFVLLSEHQTTGGYPRIGTVLPPDLPRIAQLPPGAQTTFCLVDLETAEALATPDEERLKRLSARLSPVIRDPHKVDLLGLNLIDGVTTGADDPPPT